MFSRMLEALQGLPALFMAAGGNFYWPYLLSNLLLAMAAMRLWRHAPQRGALRQLGRAVFPLNRSTAHDLALFIGNLLLISALLNTVLLSAETVAQRTSAWLFAHATQPAIDLPASLETLQVTLCALLAADLGFYVSHRLQHTIPLLWEFHKVHHSATSLNPFTVFRRHPVDYVIDHLCMGGLLGITLGTANFLFDGYQLITVWQQNIGYFLFALLGAHLQHSQVWLSWGRLDAVFISPATHQLHHSTATRHLDRNFGNVMAVWDVFFGSIAWPSQGRAPGFGLYDASEQTRFNSLASLYWLPVRACWRRMFLR